MSDSMKEYSEWRKQGLVLRRQIEAQRKRLLIELEALDDTLAQLPQEGKPGSVDTVFITRGGPLLNPKESVAKLVEKIVSAEVKPLTSGEIIATVKKVRPDASEGLIHSSISRLVSRGKVAAHGKTGTRRYSQPKPKEWLRMEEEERPQENGLDETAKH